MEYEEWKNEMEIINLRQKTILARIENTSKKLADVQTNLITVLLHCGAFLPVEIYLELRDVSSNHIELTVDMYEIVIGLGEVTRDISNLSAENIDKYRKELNDFYQKMKDRFM